jgi:hypothetical protein
MSRASWTSGSELHTEQQIDMTFVEGRSGCYPNAAEAAGEKWSWSWPGGSHGCRLLPTSPPPVLASNGVG